MTEDDLTTDGNGVAGILSELLTVEVTTMMRTCHSCGAQNPVAAHRAYHGAGLVLRCPACEDVALRVGVLDDGLVFEWRGTLRTRHDAA
jgi:Family of unknown function (DUF6510)